MDGRKSPDGRYKTPNQPVRARETLLLSASRPSWQPLSEETLVTSFVSPTREQTCQARTGALSPPRLWWELSLFLPSSYSAVMEIHFISTEKHQAASHDDRMYCGM